MNVKTLVIRGEQTKETIASQTEYLDIEQEFIISGSTRGEAAIHTVPLDDANIIEFVFDDDTVWMSTPDKIKEVFPEAAGQLRSTDLAPGVFELPSALFAMEQERGIFKNVVLKIVRIFSKKTLAEPLVATLVHTLAEKLEAKLLGDQKGLVWLNKAFEIKKAPVKSDGIYLLFLHGTAASAATSFNKLINKSVAPVWDFIFETYGENVLAFQYESLTKSPLQNVIDLVSELPRKATLHIISQSGGGLVGDILNRFCIKDQAGFGFSADEKNYLNRQKRGNDVKLIEAIEGAIIEKDIKIEKFIRVACPASGSSLATKRLDHFLNTLFNVLGYATGLAANPIYIAFKDLIAGVLQTKSDPDVLPGVEVLSPFSPLNKVLNNAKPAVEISTPLIVIAGEAQVALRWNALLVILTKLYYLGANDFIVNTKSMFNGAKRVKGKAQYFLDKGSNVNHFSYFENDKTRGALLLALQHTGDAIMPGFVPVSQREFTEEEIRFAGLDGGAFLKNIVTGKKPIAVLLPGIMGSNLSVKDALVWINYLGFIRGGLMQLKYSVDNNLNVKAASIIKTSYEKLGKYLSDDYDVLTFPFDWRLPLDESAKALNSKLIELMQYNQPIKLIGHSMGGVLVRDFIINHEETWTRLNASRDFRLLFLGSPLGGSFRIPYVLFGKDDIINKLAMIDIFNSKKELLSMFSQLPGILCLLPIRKDNNEQGDSYDFALPETWRKMNTAFEDQNDITIPNDDILKKFGAYRDAVINKNDTIDYSKAVYIAGQVRKNKDTPSGYRIVDGSLEFLSTKEGDESVTWESGIPTKMITNGNVYYSDITHGELANDVRLFDAISEVLEKGETTLLRKTPPAVRSIEKEFVSREIYDFDTSKEGVENSLLGLDNEASFNEGKTPVNVSVSNGDLKYATYPVLVGHFYRDGILNAEQSIDNYLNKELSNRHKLGLYPGEIGTCEILLANKDGFKGVVVAGLGMQGQLTAYGLMRSIEQAVSKYLARYNSNIANGIDVIDNQKPIGISPLIVGCGYGGLSIENAVTSILQGVQNANEKIRQIYTSAKTVDNVEFIELYRDRALAAVHALDKIEKDENRTICIAWGKTKIRKQLGWRERLVVDSTNEWWTRITVRKNNKANANNDKTGLLFTISTDAAREEERFLGADSETVKQLLEEISIKNRWNADIAKAFFELLIPNDFKDQVKRQGNLNWIVDTESASFPWELLQDASGKALPLCVNAGMIRQLATKEYRIKIHQVIENTALVIGDPNLENPAMQLPGAFKEGSKAYELLNQNGYATTKLLNASAADIMLALFSKSYKIVHLAGHGAFNTDPSKPSGMLIGKNAFLTTFEVDQMGDVPELVFVNCCYLGQMNAETEDFYQDRYKLAANIGTGLIEIGVKAVIVAGWAVDDAAALDFMTRFYQCMFDGDNFGTAIKNARKKIYDDHGERTNTWGAYQCYGDPFYTLDINDKPWPDKYDFVIAEEAENELSNLLNQQDIGGDDIEKTVLKIQLIAAAVDKTGIRNGRITELEALLYSTLNRYGEAIQKFEQLLQEEHASYSFSATEKYCNVRAKYYVQQVKDKNKKREEVDNLMKKVINDLEGMINFCSSVERLNILASTYKRYASISKEKERAASYASAARCYQAAYYTPTNKSRYYSLANWLSVENGLVSAGLRNWGDKIKCNGAEYVLPKDKKAAIQLLKVELQNSKEETGGDVEYWDLVAKANLLLCLLLLGYRSSKKDDLVVTCESVLSSYMNVWNYAGHRGYRAAEIEQFEFLEDLFGMVPAEKTKDVLKNISYLKKALLAMA